MKNQEIARIFSEMAEILEIKGDNPFKIRAYRRAALNIEGLPRSVEELSKDELREIPGIGEELAAKIEEYVQTGSMHTYDKLKGEIPPGLLALLAVPGLGPKTARLLFDKLHVTSLDELERLAAEHRLSGVPGIQKKTEENILKGIASVKRGRERQPLGKVLPIALDIVEQIRKRAPVDRIEIAGSIRRWKETIKDIDIVATSANPEKVMEVFVSLPLVESVVLHGPTRSSVVIREGLQVDLRVVERDALGAALAYLTGSKGHNIRLRDMAAKQGLKINEYGIFREKDDKRLGGEEEEDVYRLLGLPYIPPELREDLGEVEAALAGKLPRLITREDIRGDLHVHSRWSDGHHTFDELVAAAKARGYTYFALTDHSRGLGVAHGLTIERLMEQKREITELNRRLTGFTVLHGTEMDIRGDGTLDFPDEVLKELDIVIASIHSGFRQSKEQMTSRIVSAMRNPYVSIIAHPTGRLIGERDAYEVEMDEVIRVAGETGTVLEINAYPLRLDLSDTYARRAKEMGVTLAINTDTHVIDQFDTMPYGISIARRSWLEKGDVLNTLELPALLHRIRQVNLVKSER
ncbi:MAG: DNA polymerase [Geobacteraceae bacterium]|nr:MAG: DNA polymerase [Geobacteraceae bacterium]